MITACIQCGRRVPRWGAVARTYTVGTKGYTLVPNPRAGQPRVSSHMSVLDPCGMFCTMRCAVVYAVRKANG